MISVYGESDGDYDEAIRHLLLMPRSDTGRAVAALHERLLRCQVDTDDLALFRDKVLVPTLVELLARPKPEAAMVEEMLWLVAMTAEPTEGPALDAWKSMLAALQKPSQHYDQIFAKRRASVRRERANPPAMVKYANFCGATEGGQEVTSD
jgi:hypothetical protein